MNKNAPVNLYGVLANSKHRPALIDVYAPYRELVVRYAQLMESNPEEAAEVWSLLQITAKAFWSGVDFACGASG